MCFLLCIVNRLKLLVGCPFVLVCQMMAVKPWDLRERALVGLFMSVTAIVCIFTYKYLTNEIRIPQVLPYKDIICFNSLCVHACVHVYVRMSVCPVHPN